MNPATQLTTYRCAEAVSEANRAAGWEIEYRQLGRGRYRSQFGMRALSSVLLATDSFESLVEIIGQPPKDMVMLAIPFGDQPEGILSRGRTLTSDHFDLIEANSGCEWNIPPGTSMNQAYIPRNTLCRAYRRLFKENMPENLKELQTSSKERLLIGKLRFLTAMGLWSPDTATHYQNALSGDIVDLCAQIVACRVKIAPGRRKISESRRQIVYKAAREYIDRNLGHSILISDVCCHANVSISTLERVFLQTAGLTPLKYVQSRRMNRARHLLLGHGGELTIAEIALRCGFSHFGRFSRSYRAYFRELPSNTIRSIM